MRNLMRSFAESFNDLDKVRALQRSAVRVAAAAALAMLTLAIVALGLQTEEGFMLMLQLMMFLDVGIFAALVVCMVTVIRLSVLRKRVAEVIAVPITGN